MPTMTTEEILAATSVVEAAPAEEPRDPELWRVAKLLAASQGISREEAWVIVEAKGAEIKAKAAADTAAKVAEEKAAEAAEAAAKAEAAKAALDAMLAGGAA